MLVKHCKCSRPEPRVTPRQGTYCNRCSWPVEMREDRWSRPVPTTATNTTHDPKGAHD